MSRARWQALGTSAELLVVGDTARLATARAAVERCLDEIDRACSRFREDSELTRVNACADGKPTGAEPLLVEAMAVALRAAAASGGLVDPTVGRAMELVGYDRDWTLLEPPTTNGISARHGGPPTPAGHAAASPCQRPPRQRPLTPRVRAQAVPGWKAVKVDRGRNTIKLPSGVKLDLGATAKAWAADRAAKAAHAATGVGVLVSLGGDVATAGECPRQGWRVHVTDDHRSGPDAPGQTIAIAGGGLATSSTAVRRWKHGGSTMHHILDPRTGMPADTPWRTVSVAAGDCADANTAATAALVRGSDAPRWLAELGLPARLVDNEGAVMTVAGWPAEDAPMLDGAAATGEVPALGGAAQPKAAQRFCGPAQPSTREIAA